MENLNLTLYVSIIIPLGFAMIIFDKKARVNFLFMMIGLTVCLFCGELSTIVASQIPFSMRYITTNITPVIEEFFKALPILIYAFVYDPKKHQLYEAAIAVGVGFAILENAYILAGDADFATLIYGILRGLGAGTLHALATFLVGVGMSYIHKKPKLFYTGTVALLSTAIIIHSIYNSIISTDFYVIGMLIPVSIFIPTVLYLKKKKLL